MNNFKNIATDIILEATLSSKFRGEILTKLNCEQNSHNYKKLEEWMINNNINPILYTRMKKSEYILNPFICKHCNKILSWEQRRNEFCSHSCSASFNNSSVSKVPIKLCLNCEKEIPTRNKYCNNVCQNEYEYKLYISDWLENKKDGMSGLDGISNHIRKYLFIKHSNACQICGWNVVNTYINKVPLTIHHIDGDATNNKEENLQLLCPNCHSLTSTYGGANRGNSTRKYRYSKK